jgi:hypothetical protein
VTRALPWVEEEGETGGQVVKSCPLVPIVGWRGEGAACSWDLVLFRLVAPPLQPRVVGHIGYGAYDSSVICRWREPVVSRILGRN